MQCATPRTLFITPHVFHTCLKIHHQHQTDLRPPRSPRTISNAQAKRSSSTDSVPQFAEWSQSIPSTSYPWTHPTSVAMSALTLLEAAALVGAIVGGVLARKRRKQLEKTNQKLRMINQELRRQKEITSAAEDLGSYRTALEQSFRSISAAHPVETDGSLQVSLARARRQVEQGIQQIRKLLSTNPTAASATEALPLLAETLQMSRDIKDARAERAVYRLRARALRVLGDLNGSIGSLQKVLELTEAVGEGADADTLGEMGDILAEMGDFEAAGMYYDRCIDAIQSSTNDNPSSSTTVSSSFRDDLN